jgi:hypothetical protein
MEQKIRVIKERVSGTFNTLPYKKLPKLMVRVAALLCDVAELISR